MVPKCWIKVWQHVLCQSVTKKSKEKEFFVNFLTWNAVKLFPETLDLLDFFAHTVFSRLEAHYIIEAPPIVRGSSQLPETFYRMKIGQFSRELWAFFWINVTFEELFKEISLARLIIVWFSTQNHRWKARNLLYQFQLSDLDLHSRRAPLNGRIR